MDETYGYIASVVAPVYDSTGEPVALVGVDISMPGVKENIASFILTTSINIIIVILLFIIALLVVVRQKLLRPIGLLNRASQKMVENLENEETVSIDIRTGDEVEELARSFERMYGEVKDYIARLFRNGQTWRSMQPCIRPRRWAVTSMTSS